MIFPIYHYIKLHSSQSSALDITIIITIITMSLTFHLFLVYEEEISIAKYVNNYIDELRAKKRVKRITKFEKNKVKKLTYIFFSIIIGYLSYLFILEGIVNDKIKIKITIILLFIAYIRVHIIKKNISRSQAPAWERI